MISRWNGNQDSCTFEWLQLCAAMMDEGAYVTLTDESGKAFVTVDVLTAQDLVEAA